MAANAPASHRRILHAFTNAGLPFRSVLIRSGLHGLDDLQSVLRYRDGL